MMLNSYKYFSITLKRMEQIMAQSVCRSSLNTCIFVFLLSLLLLNVPAWGVEGAQGAKEAAKPATGAAVTGTIDEQIAAARASVKADPANASLHVRLANLLLGKGALDEAMRSFDEALKLNPRAYDAKTGRGAVLCRQGKLKEAEQALQDALLLNPNPVRTHYELGLVYGKLGDLEKGAAQFKEGIRKHEQGRM